MRRFTVDGTPPVTALSSTLSSTPASADAGENNATSTASTANTTASGGGGSNSSGGGNDSSGGGNNSDSNGSGGGGALVPTSQEMLTLTFSATDLTAVTFKCDLQLLQGGGGQLPPFFRASLPGLGVNSTDVPCSSPVTLSGLYYGNWTFTVRPGGGDEGEGGGKGSGCYIFCAGRGQGPGGRGP